MKKREDDNVRAFLGTGLLGSGFVEGMIARGEAVQVWNRTAAKTQPLAAKGALAKDLPSDAVREARIVHMCLSDDAAVDSVIDAIVSSLRADAWLVDHTTTSPEKTRERYRRMHARGVHFAHAPVFMSPANAREAKGLMLLSGPRERVDTLTPLLSSMTGELVHVGERDELAAAMKLFGNAVLISITGGLADVLAMGRALGIEPETVMSIFQKFDAGAGIKVRGARMARGDFAPSFELSMAQKDVRLMTDAAAGQTLTVLPALAQRMEALIARGHGADDLGVLAIDAIAKKGEGDEGPRARVMERLRACHRRIDEELSMLADVAAHGANDDDVTPAVESAVAFADRTIVRHEEDEERSLFPRAIVVAAARPIIERLTREHEEQRVLWDRIRQGDVSEGSELATFARKLEGSYAEHMRVEEQELFPLLEDALDEAEWKAIDDEMMARRGRGGGGGGGGGGRRRR